MSTKLDSLEVQEGVSALEFKEKGVKLEDKYLRTFQVEDGDGTEVTIKQGSEIKLVEGGGIDINFTDTNAGSDADPFDLTFKVTNAPYIAAVDDRDVKPAARGFIGGVKAFFTSLAGLTGAANSDYQDLLVLDTYRDASGGYANALAFDKSTKTIRHYQASQTATSWGTPLTIAYTNSDITGNAASATKLKTARTIALAGDATGSTTFDGTANKTITVTVKDDSHNHVISNVDGLQSALNGKVDDSQVLTNVPAGAVFTDTQRAISDSVSSTSTSVSASSKAAKTAYDKGVSAYNLAASKMTQGSADARYLGITAKAVDSDKLDGLDSSKFSQWMDKKSGSCVAGWVTIATAGGGRGFADVYVWDNESSDHAFMHIEFVRSYADSSISVRSVGGHAKRITGARVIKGSDDTYGEKRLQVYVTTTSVYNVRIKDARALTGYTLISAYTPTLQNMPSGWSLENQELTGLTAAGGGTDTTGVVQEQGHRVFSPNNRNISDAVNSTSSIIYASAKAVKSAYDKAVSAYNLANSKWTHRAATTSQTGTSQLSDSVSSTSSVLSATAKAVKTAYDKGVSAYNLAASKMTQGSADARYLGITAKAADSNLFDGLDNTVFQRNDRGLIPVPQGGTLRTTDSTRTGVIKIALPVSWTSTMLSFVVTVYEYTTNQSFKLHIGGYNYGTNSAWVNTTATLISGDRNMRVRFGHDGAKCCVYIGEDSENWSYTQVAVSDVHYGFGDSSWARWATGWAISLGGQTVQNVDVNKLAYRAYTGGYKPTKADVGLSVVNNWGATSSVSDASNNKYSTAGAVKAAYDKAVAALNAANTKWAYVVATTSVYGATKLSSATNSTSQALAATPKAVKAAYDLAVTKITKTQGDSYYLGKTAKAADSNLLDGVDSGSFLRSDATDYQNNTIYQRGYLVNETGYRNRGVYGNYDLNKINHIWSMGVAYKVDANGANFGNLYGLAYKHINNTTGGTMAGGHQAVWCTAGNPKAAMGDNGLWGLAVYDGTGNARQRVFSPNNRNISDVVNSASTTVYASSKAVKAAYDLANSKWTHRAASTSQTGTSQLSDSVTSTSSVLSATSKAVKAAYDKGVQALNAANAKWTYAVATTSVYGATKLSNATNSTSQALAATPKAVKAAYDLAASKVSKSQGDSYYLGKTAKAADANLLDGKDSTAFVQTSGAQNVAGKKTFSDEIGVTANASIKYNPTTESIDFVFS